MSKSKKKTTKSYESIDEIFCDLADILRPPERLSVSLAAAKYRYVNQPGAYVGPWENATAPYMVEPMDTYASDEYTGMVFVGPAQSGKTDAMLINTILYSVLVDPMDTMIVCPSQHEARDFSMRRVDRLHLHSKQVGEMLLGSRDADNTFDKQYRNGMLLSLSWPTPTNLAGKPIGRVLLTDRDRMPDDIMGDGEPYDLAAKRTTTFGSNAMCVAESSPSRPVENLKWIPSSPHEAPPAAGILALYNRGDRRRWYWPCPHCSQYFEGTFEMLTYERRAGMTNLDVGETARMKCPHCGESIHPDEREDMQMWGIWLKDGQGIDKSGKVFGPRPRTLIASFWLRGVAAAFVSWKKLVTLYLDAMDEFERTRSEEALKKFYNNDLGEPYYPQSASDTLLPEVLKSRSEHLRERHVPEGVRFLVATIDVQKNMWVVQVFGILPGRPFDTVVIDRYQVKYSKRLNEADERLWVKPHTYLEDWDELIEHVIDKEYPLDDDSGRMMAIKYTCCDSGGKAGVTTMAYNFYRRLKELNKHRRFILVKGDPTNGNPRARISYPDSSRRDSKAGARGDIPVLMLNSNLLKDDLSGRLECVVPGAGMYRTPDWLPDNFYNELCAETRGPKGWENTSGERNEAGDLSYYCIGLCISELLRVESIDWSNPPSWAAEWDKNDLIRGADEQMRFTAQGQTAYDFGKYAKALA